MIAEFLIRGVSMNILFYKRSWMPRIFDPADLTTSFIDEWPQLLTVRTSVDRDTKPSTI